MKFKKKPIVIDAVQWFKDGDHAAVQMCWFQSDGQLRATPNSSPLINVYGCVQSPAIKTLEGWHQVTPGDWIITGVKGEVYPCKPDIFNMTYDKVE